MVQFGFEWRTGSIVITLAKTLTAALAVAVVEEIVFRGFLLRCLVAAIGHGSGLVLSSLFFAYVHFKGANAVFQIADVPTFSDSCSTASAILFGFLRPFRPTAFLSLFLLGLLFGMWTLRSRHLMAAIGFHWGVASILILQHRLFVLGSASSAASAAAHGLIESPFCPILLAVLVGFYAHVQQPNNHRRRSS
jgi:membrane protease YdiL (CAAX protease family)